MPTYTYSLVSAAFAIIPLSLVSVVFATKYAALWLLLRLPLATVCLHIYSLISVAFATTYDMYAAPWLALVCHHAALFGFGYCTVAFATVTISLVG